MNIIYTKIILNWPDNLKFAWVNGLLCYEFYTIVHKYGKHGVALLRDHDLIFDEHSDFLNMVFKIPLQNGLLQHMLKQQQFYIVTAPQDP